MPVKIANKVVFGGPANSVPPHLSIGQYYLDNLRESDDGIALVNAETGAEVTRKGFLESVVRLAAGLRRRGLRRGHVVALCSESRVEVLVTALAALCCGAAVTTANLLYTDEELTHAMDISKPNLFICSAAALKKHIHILNKFDYVKTIVQFDEVKTADNRVVLFNTLLDMDVDVDSYEPEDVLGQMDTAFILYSSGTTGLPKGVMLTHLNMMYYVNNSRNDENLKRYLTVVPWYHGYGLLSSLSNIMKGKTTIFLNAFNPELYLNAIQKYKIEVLLAVPPIIVFLTKSPMVDNYDVNSVQSIWCAAAPLTSDTIKDALKRFPNCKAILQAYGMTETTLPVSQDSPREGSKHKPGSGGAPLPGVKIKVVDIDSRQKLAAYEKGEICVKGPNLMKGYMGKEQESRDILDEEGYLKTGDIGYYDSDGYFFIVDRLKELIKYKGHQVPPAELESVVLQHGAVAECGVAGAPDAAAGELAVAFVVRKPGAAVTEKEIVDFAASKLSPPKRLHGGVIFVSEVPKNPSGKILRRVLRERLRRNPPSKL